MTNLAHMNYAKMPGGCRFCDAYQELSIIDGIAYVDIKHDPNCYSVKHDGALVKGEYRTNLSPYVDENGTPVSGGS